ncbi:hypothetical protein M3J09_000102 [Ascochyta lentis]
MSPISNGSGSNTPVQAAPEVPSMLPVTQKSTMSYTSSAETLNMETLNVLRSRKAIKATNVSQGTAGTTSPEIKIIKAQLKVAQLGEAKLQTRVKELEDQVEEFKALPAQLAALKAQVENSNPAVDTDLASIREDIKSMKEQRQQQAMKCDTVEVAIKTAIQPEIKRIDALRTEHIKTQEGMSKKLEASQSLCEDLNKRNLPGQLLALQNNVKDLSNTIHTTGQKVTDHDSGLKYLRTDIDNLYDDVREYIGPIKRSYTDANKTTVIERIESQEEKLRAFRKEQEYLSGEQKKLSTKVDSLPADPTDSMSKRLGDMENIVSSLGEDTQQLANRVDILEAVPATSVLAASSTDNEQLNKAVDSLKTRVSDSENILKRVQDNQLEQQSKNGLIQALQSEQARLSNEHVEIVGQIEKVCSEQESLANEQNALHTGRTKLSDEQTTISSALESLNDRVSASEKILEQIEPIKCEQAKLAGAQNKINDRVTKLETAPRQAVARQSTVGDSTHVSFDIENIQQRLCSVEDRIDGEGGLAKIIDAVQDDCDRIENQVHNNSQDIEMCESNFAAIFEKNFDPFKAAVEQQLAELSQSITHHSESLARLRDRVAEQRTASQASGLTAAQLATLTSVVHDTVVLSQAVAGLQNSVKNEADTRDTVVQDLKEQLASKQDTISATQATDTVKAAVRNLQDQYNNITTEDLHAKIVHWFLQQYPSTPANLVHQVADLQHEVARLRDLTSQTSWDPRYTQVLIALAQIGPQLQALVQSPSGSDGSPETLAKANEALTTLKEALTKSQRETEGLTRTVGALQTSMHALNSSNTPFAKTESIAALQQSMITLQADIKATLTEEHRARNELAAKVDTEHNDRVKAEDSIVHAMNGRLEELENGKIKAASERVESLQHALTKVCADLDEMHDKFLTPTNKVLFSRLPTLFVVTGQLQDLLESLNQNLPKGPLDFTWHHDFNADLGAVPAPQAD